MNNLPKNQEVAGIKGNGSLRERVQCELIVYDPTAVSISVKGLGENSFDSLSMTQTTDGIWLVRLYFAPGMHTVSVSVRRFAKHAKDLPTQCNSWDAEFEVPLMKHGSQVKSDLRIWLHNSSHRPRSAYRINTS